MAVEHRIFPYSGQADLCTNYAGSGSTSVRHQRQVLSTIDRESFALLGVRYLAGC